MRPHTTQTKTGGSVPLPRVGGALSARSQQYQVTAESMSTAAKSGKRRSRLCSVLGLPGPAMGEPFWPARSLSLRAEGAHGRTIGRCGQARGARRQRDHGHGAAGHVEELDLALLGDIRHDVSLHDRADVASTQPALGDVAGQDHVAVHVEGHVYLGYMIMNLGIRPIADAQERSLSGRPAGVTRSTGTW